MKLFNLTWIDILRNEGVRYLLAIINKCQYDGDLAYELAY